MSSERECATCAYWSLLDYPPQLNEGRETNPLLGDPVGGDWGYCGRVGILGPTDPQLRFFAWDASGYSAGLTTRSDFGCVEYQADE